MCILVCLCVSLLHFALSAIANILFYHSLLFILCQLTSSLSYLFGNCKLNVPKTPNRNFDFHHVLTTSFHPFTNHNAGNANQYGEYLCVVVQCCNARRALLFLFRLWQQFAILALCRLLAGYHHQLLHCVAIQQCFSNLCRDFAQISISERKTQIDISEARIRQCVQHQPIQKQK